MYGYFNQDPFLHNPRTPHVDEAIAMTDETAEKACKVD